ncbi:hypothetical protein GWC95_15515 [Sediminibacterium roseum]|uniref:beta-glucosidase n=1 Tax=Sediminibacterium roseum TaxID=1978412 RepID=A0ABX0A2H8_9BACT|nr:glycoside hydrolase family 3 N-terminal domain-containing protein [Sediminibacterium roseum]NCI51336.1 hypothetical protein [Sediminibacterium roseum]
MFPLTRNKWLLTDVLRKEWGYKGVVVSDSWAIDQLYNKHLVATDKMDAALQALNAGVTVDLPYGNNYERLIQLVKDGKIPMKDLDEAVAYVLRLKFKMGLFDNPPAVTLEGALKHINQPEGRELSRIAAERSMVLLKNQNNILPLQKANTKQ